MAAVWDVKEWTKFLDLVDEATAETEDIEKAAKFLVTVKSVKQASFLEGVLESELLACNGAPAELGAKGLIRRAIKVAQNTAEAKRSRTSSAGASSKAATGGGDQFQLSLLGRPVGDAGSALALASAMQANQVPNVDIQALLATKDMDGLQYHCQALHGLWQLLASRGIFQY